MAPKAAQQAAQKKAAKQKKLLLVLVLVLVVVLVLAFTTLMPSNSSTPVSAEPAASTTPASSTTTTPSGSPAAPAASPGISPAPVGSLRAFGTLGRKDPFNDNGPDLTSSPAQTPKQTAGSSNHAVISVNGKKFSVALGAKFGHTKTGVGAALFRLAKISDQTAVVTVIATKQNFTLHLRQPLALVQKGAWKETLILEPAGTGATVTVKRTSKG